MDIRNFISKRISQYLNESTTNNIWYHGSNKSFNTFKIKNGTLFDASYQSPIFLTSNKDFAKHYAGHHTPFIYTVQVITNNIMDFKQLPTSYDLYMYNEKNKINNINQKYYVIGNNLFNFIEDKFPNDNIDKLYNNLLDNDYSSVEQTWVYDWLKLNNYDGAFITETNELNLLIFDDSKLNIIKTETL